MGTPAYPSLDRERERGMYVSLWDAAGGGNRKKALLS